MARIRREAGEADLIILDDNKIVVEGYLNMFSYHAMPLIDINDSLFTSIIDMDANWQPEITGSNGFMDFGFVRITIERVDPLIDDDWPAEA